MSTMMTQAAPKNDQRDPSRSGGDEAQILAMIAKWRTALENRDLDGLVADYVPDAVLFDVHPTYKIVGPAAIRAAWEQCLPFFPKTFKSEHRDVKLVVGDDVAFGHMAHHILAVDEPQHPASGSWIRVTVGYRKVAGQWKVCHEHVSMPFDCATGKLAPITDADVGP
jgi:uncharacterized protein (TIGR02246 family)